MSGVPEGYRQLATARVYVNGSGKLVITAEPGDVWPQFGEDHDDEHPHNCDAQGCRWEHVVARAELDEAQP